MVMNFVTSTVNTVVDFAIFIIPIPILVKLQIERKKKGKLTYPIPFCRSSPSVVALVSTFSVGLLSITASIVRLRNMVHFNGVGDFTYVADMVPVTSFVLGSFAGVY